MNVTPLTTYTAKNVALLAPGHKQIQIETMWGRQTFKGDRDIQAAFRRLDGFVCYVTSSLDRLRHVTSAREWTLTTWKGLGVRMVHEPSGVKVTSLRSTLDGSSDPFGDLVRVIRWLGSYGVTPGPLSSMSWALWRASLSRPISIMSDPLLTGPAFFGGRQQITKAGASYKSMRSLDIKGAYPYAMQCRPFALSLREVDASTQLDGDVAGLAQAKVHVPDSLAFPPLPVRLAKSTIQFQWGDLEGTWTWGELAHAIGLGCDIEVIKCYAPGREADLFGSWFNMSAQGRDLPGCAATLAKSIANSLWGQFAMTGDTRSEVSWCDDPGEEPYFTLLPERHLPHEYARQIAVETTSRVRTQTLREGVYDPGCSPVHIDTDGIIISSSDPIPKNVGDGFGQWRVKDEMKRLEIKAPQFYRYRRPEEREGWHYVASGVNQDQAKKIFDRHSDTTLIGYLSSIDVCLPPVHSRDRLAIDIFKWESERLMK